MFEKEIPLIVDLDGTITKSDLFFETLVIFIKKNPLNIFFIFFWLFFGKSFLKLKLSEKITISPSDIKYRKEVINYLNHQKQNKRKIYLFSGSSINQVKEVHDYLNIFDGYYGTTINLNLISYNKLNYIKKFFGSVEFDYIGDSSKDIVLWNASRKAIIVDPKFNINKKIKISSKNIIYLTDFISKKDKAKIFFKSIRIYQWVKNFLVFLPIILSQNFIGINFINASLAFISFSFISSATYLLNDIFDINEDREHIRKKHRPIASGEMSINSAIKIAFLLFFLSGLISIVLLPLAYFKIVFLYVFITILYTTLLKKIIYLDILILSIFYILRIIAGGLATSIDVSNWLILFSFVFFIFLAGIKRLAEIVNIINDDNLNNFGRSYNEKHFDQIRYVCMISGASSILFLSNYFFSSKVLELYNSPQYLLFACPILLLWEYKIYRNTLNKKMTDDPIIYIFKDKNSWYTFFLIGIIIIFQMKIW